jgi:hypothetical protein
MVVVASLAVAATLLVTPAVHAPASAASVAATTAASTTGEGSVQQNVFGTIRRDNATGGWYAFNDAGHRSEGIAKVENYQNKALKVTFTTPAAQVGSFSATPDETLVRMDIRMGTTVGLTHAFIYLYRGSSTNPLNPNTITSASANIWIDARNWVTPAP